MRFAAGVFVGCCGAPEPAVAAALAAAAVVTAAAVRRWLLRLSASQGLLRVSLELSVLLAVAKEEEKDSKEQRQRRQRRQAAEWPRQCTGAAATLERSCCLRLRVKTEVIPPNFYV